MSDVFSKKKRSKIMSRVRGHGNAATELRLIKILRTHKIRGWRRRSKIFGRPDFIFPAQRLALFVDGCFWHGCPQHFSIPLQNREFWLRKIERNIKRDKLVRARLRIASWRILRIWQHELKNPDLVARRIRKSLSII